MAPTLDCLIVGGGPAGLTAAIYLARYRLSVRVVDAGDGRAAQIPCTRNHAGFPDGISGEALLRRMREQATRFGVEILAGEVVGLAPAADALRAETTLGTMAARAVLLATGVTNHDPDMPADLRRTAIAQGRLRYCPVCDGYEVTDQAVAVIGVGAKGAKEALFLRGYTARVTLISQDGGDALSPEDRAALVSAGIEIVDGPASAFALSGEGLSFSTARGRRAFEAVYPALGSQAHSALARQMGAALTEEGCIKVDAHQRTSAPRLCAAGDVVIGLDQISHAMGEAGVAATAIRNDLSDERPLRR